MSGGRRGRGGWEVDEVGEDAVEGVSARWSRNGNGLGLLCAIGRGIEVEVEVGSDVGRVGLDGAPWRVVFADGRRRCGVRRRRLFCNKLRRRAILLLR